MITLLVPRAHVKRVKTALEKRGLLRGRISAEERGDGGGDGDGDGRKMMRMRIGATLSAEEVLGWKRMSSSVDDAYQGESGSGSEEGNEEGNREGEGEGEAKDKKDGERKGKGGRKEEGDGNGNGNGNAYERDPGPPNLSTILHHLGLPDLLPQASTSDPAIAIEIEITPPPSLSPFQTPSSPNYHKKKNALLQALARALSSSLPPSLLASLDLTPDILLNEFPSTYTVYKPLLLLPPNALASPAWRKLTARIPVDGEVMGRVWGKVTKAVGATCVAVNRGIPARMACPTRSPTSPPSLSKADEGEEEQEGQEEENILRLPTHLSPIYGYFGPAPTAQRQHHPTPSDFSSALWVSCTQNGLLQTWAPRYSMFSRGNVKEKARILGLASETVKAARGKGEECTAVDLYAGIGYFAFSYKKAGFKKVLCWEMNPWSVEGLRRGAGGNGWSVGIFHNPEEEKEEEIGELDILVFPESNSHAFSRISQLKNLQSPPLPPIRHVNCGFLPSSRLSWRTAVRVLDVRLGGYIHCHENVGVADIEERREEVQREIGEFLDEWEWERERDVGVAVGRGRERKRRVECRHVERVKTFAPGVIHVCFDVYVEGEDEVP
ncbi:uncharacterized protein EI97DRAFT_469978 [Westerdykella ornata]|uniref:tRNA(Phe) (4-demethylwyosine(37)-C(7)) aminocarboxypropyltransferase n=1 Tax=Westerdykella ornata TaxID=318751 RepID=A0A6A6JAQ5_WESOR|nr:uncharacterized protein EI97DRAFT_469978 [Westerdykella ornata]KAF2273058.1 hypothetical protein EI97DRAFT_469978 [Westerdykella ornata]